MSDCNTDWNILQKTIHQLSPAQKVHLFEDVAKSLRQSSAASDSTARKTNIERLRNDLAGLPTENPNDGFSGREHDKILYGE